MDTKKTTNKFSAEVRERAVRMVRARKTRSIGSSRRRARMRCGCRIRRERVSGSNGLLPAKYGTFGRQGRSGLYGRKEIRPCPNSGDAADAGGDGARKSYLRAFN